MPGQRRTPGPATRGSWLPRLAGLSAIVVLVGAGTAVYLLEFHPAPAQAQHPAALPTTVASTQTVGLVAMSAQRGETGHLVQLLGSGASLVFSPVGASEAVDGHPEWIADQMSDGSYIFIFLPTSDCLAAAGPSGRLVLESQRCNLSLQQRWREEGRPTVKTGHDFYEFASAANGKCIMQDSAVPTGPSLGGCDPAQPASELLAFWWSAN